MPGRRVGTLSLDYGSTPRPAEAAVVAIPIDDGARQTATALGYGQPAASAYQQTYRQQTYGQQTYGAQQGYGQYPTQGWLSG